MFEDIFGGFDDFSDITNEKDEVVSHSPVNSESNTATIWSTTDRLDATIWSTKDQVFNNDDSPMLWEV